MTALNVNTIEEAKAQYDAEAKRLLAQRPILSRILLGTMDELEGLTPDEVAACIEGVPDVAKEPVEPGSAISGGPTEDAVPGEGKVYYDIRTFINVPGEAGPVRVIVNVEAQRDYSPGYEMVTRGVYYTSRLISAQHGIEFEHSGYDSIKKVYSIWICMNAPKAVGNAISSWSFKQENRLGDLPDKPAAYDKAEVVVIALDEEQPCDDDLVGMLNLVLSPAVSKEKKKEGLEGRYNIEMKGDVAEGVNIMCNLSGYVEERAEKRGREDQLMDLVIGHLKRGRSYEQIADSLMISIAEVKRLEEKALAPA